jgi:dsRNA-specific ribonuclease
VEGIVEGDISPNPGDTGLLPGGGSVCPGGPGRGNKAAFVDLLVRAHYPTPDAITQEKKNLERHDALAGIASQIGIGPFIRLGAGEKTQGAEREPYVLAETLEAIIGAVYLDGGCEAARKAVIGWYGDRIRPHPR